MLPPAGPNLQVFAGARGVLEGKGRLVDCGWLQRRLEISKVYHQRSLNRPRKMLKPFFERFGEGKFLEIQDDVQFPDRKLDTFPVPLQARIEPWL